MKYAHRHSVLYLGNYSLALILRQARPVAEVPAKAEKRRAAFLILSNAWRSVVLSYRGGRVRWFASRAPHFNPVS